MRLTDIKRTYQAVYSLGSNCYPAQRLERYGLRPYSGVIDWMYSNSIPGLCLLLRNRFAEFMYSDHIEVDGTEFNGHNYSLLDRVYGVQSVHDFLVADQLEGIVRKYPEFQETLQRRITRFLRNIEQAEWVFFFRLHASHEEAAALEAALASIVRHQFRLLVVNPGADHRIVELDWPLAHTCAVEAPIAWDADSDRAWNELFAGIRYEAMPG